MKRFLSLLLVLLIVMPVALTGCKDKTPAETTPADTNPVATTPLVTTPTETTPEVTTPGNVEVIPEDHFVLQNASISSGNTPAEQNAAAELKKYVK